MGSRSLTQAEFADEVEWVAPLGVEQRIILLERLQKAAKFPVRFVRRAKLEDILRQAGVREVET